MRLHELTQPRQVDKDGQDEAVERQEGEHSKPERELDEKAVGSPLMELRNASDILPFFKNVFKVCYFSSGVQAK